jgi:hypothetical protein
MAHEPANPETSDESGEALDRPATVGTPRWVKVFGAIVLVVLVLFVVVSIVGGGEHGPRRHAPGGGSDNTSDTPGGHTGPPPGITHDPPQP